MVMLLLGTVVFHGKYGLESLRVISNMLTSDEIVFCVGTVMYFKILETQSR